MRLAFLALVAVAALGACSDAFVTAPPPVAPAHKIVIGGAQATGRPLIFVDGVLVGRITEINSADIEQLEIIKGPGVVALYGESRCPPIIVHTKRQNSASRADRGDASAMPNDTPDRSTLAVDTWANRFEDWLRLQGRLTQP